MIDPSGFREVIRTVSVQYPVPFVLALFLAFALACFGLAAAASPPISWVIGFAGAVAAACAAVLAFFAFFVRRELLRSEHHSLMSRAFDILLDKEAGDNARSHAGKIVEGQLLPPVDTRKISKKTLGGPASDEEKVDD